MSVSKMKKLTLVSPRKDIGRIMRKLMWLGAIELQRPSAEACKDCERNPFYSAERVNFERDIKNLENALKVLRKEGNVKRGIFTPLPRISQEDFDKGEIWGCSYADAVDIAQRVNSLKNQRKALIDKRNELIQAEKMLLPWLSCDIELSECETEKAFISFGTFPVYLSDSGISEISDSFGAFIYTVSADKTNRYVIAIYLKSRAEDCVKKLSKHGFSMLEFADMSETPAGELEIIRAKEKEILSEAFELERRLADYGKYYDELSAALDMAKTNANLAFEKEKLLCTDRTEVLFGWIPCEYTSAMEKQLSTEPVYYELDDPTEYESTPVHLVNARPAGYFESVVEMYSLPEYGKFDPTRIMMFFFFIIFGMMLADFVYGLMLSLGSFFICKKTNMPRGVKSMCAMFGVCGASCMIFGILFGSYLGDLPNQLMSVFGIEFKPWAVLDIMENSIAFLILSLAVGALHILTGMGIRFYILCKSGQVFSAIFDEGSWFILFLGVGLYFFNSTAGITVALIGALMLILTQGRAEKHTIMKLVKGIGSLYGLVNYISDLLSYSRIMALGLSSAVVASVFNILATMAGFSIPGIIAFVLILIIGHLLNLAINLLGAFVHTSRLQYVEFFGRFYEDGGRAFKPLKAVCSTYFF